MARIQIEDLPVPQEGAPAPVESAPAANTNSPRIRSGVRSGTSPTATAGIRG